MKKLYIVLLVLVASIQSFTQDVVGSRVIAKHSFFLRSAWADSLKNDTLNLNGNNRALMTANAIYDFVAGRTPYRFGVTGEDVTAMANRAFDLGTKSLSLTSNSGTNFWKWYGDATDPILDAYFENPSLSSSTFYIDGSHVEMGVSRAAASQNFYFRLNAAPGFSKADMASERLVAGTWVDTKFETNNTGSPSDSYMYLWREIWTGGPGTSSLIKEDNNGISLFTSTKVMTNPDDYLGILIDSNSDVNFTKYTAGTLTTNSSGKITATIVPSNYAADAGSNDTYSITLSPAATAYVTGMMIEFKANTANTGAATITVNGLGAKTIVKRVSTGLSDGDIAAGMFCILLYDGTNFVLTNPITN